MSDHCSILVLSELRIDVIEPKEGLSWLHYGGCYGWHYLFHLDLLDWVSVARGQIRG